jgi:hypothetical protein
MGGQACVFYGAAEFSRDVDIAILADNENIENLRSALSELDADVIAVPAFDPSFLHRGLAIHFRCKAPGVEGMRIDVMSCMRGVDPFPALWERRTTIEIDQIEIDLLSLPDLVLAKKTQRSKDWPMLERLVEAHWFQNRHHPNPQRIQFWLRECRIPEILTELAKQYPAETQELLSERILLKEALMQDPETLAQLLETERQEEVAKDKAYWNPLKKELEHLRLKRNEQ